MKIVDKLTIEQIRSLKNLYELGRKEREAEIIENLARMFIWGKLRECYKDLTLDEFINKIKEKKE